MDKGSPVKEGVEAACRDFILSCATDPGRSRFLEMIESSDVYIERVGNAEDPDAPETIARRTGLL